MKYLIDSDFLVGLFRDNDAHHLKVNNLFGEIKKTKTRLCVTNLVMQESATVLSHRDGAQAVKMFFQRLPKLHFFLIRIEEKDEKEAWRILLEQTKKGCSFVDCSNLALVTRYKINKILSFDKFYPRELRVI